MGQEVEIRGWVYNKRSSGKVRFLLIRDGTGNNTGNDFQSGIKTSPFSMFLMSLLRNLHLLSVDWLEQINGHLAATNWKLKK